MTMDLIAEVRKRLNAADPSLAARFDIAFKDSNGMSEERQMAELNDYWRHQFGLLTECTIEVRSKLVDNIQADWWLSNFDRYVIKKAVKYGLPYADLTVR